MPSIPTRLLIAWLAIGGVVGCDTPRRYNSLDLALLPCEQGAPSTSFGGPAPRFFRPIEFDENGAQAFPSQVLQLKERLQGIADPPTSAPPPVVTDLVFFIHGWNKNPSSAEPDYQNFLCRLHAHLPLVAGDRKRAGGLVVVGIFWPSTISGQERDSFVIKPVSYYRMRDRADAIAKTGLAPLLNDLTDLIKASRPRVQLIGHSFGGRMMVRAIETLDHDNLLVPFLQAADSVNVVLLNAAIPPERFEWLSTSVAEARKAGTPARISADTNSYLFNVHSFNDDANRVLFRIASVFNDDPETCAAGACGVPSFPTLCVDDSGQIRNPGLQTDVQPPFNAWNVDATRIVFDHSDIYKGRVAALISTLIFEDDMKRSLRAPTSLPAMAARCDWLGNMK